MEFKASKLNKLKKNFYKDDTNRIIQNSLCSNHLLRISEVREYMQSRDCDFSHVLDPELVVSNQGLSGRCWMFAFLNVIRHELVRKYQLPHDFELSESYLCFYEKIEKCNYFLSKFLEKDKINSHDLKTQGLLLQGCEDGGHWITCANLIKKYGIIPKTCFRESINSFSTETMNSILNYKLREFSLQLVREKDHSKRIQMKDTMMEQIYDMLCKLLGTPINPNEKFQWSFTLRLDLNEQLEREKKRHKSEGQFENLKLKKTLHITPLNFYNDFIVNDINDYLRIGNDPRNKYNQYYESYEENIVIGGERNGFYNLDMDEISKICINSITDNTPVEFDCDVSQYINPFEELLDTKCYNYDLLFNTSFNSLSKKEMMECLESYPNHAMVLTGVDLDSNNKPIKWKVENSWGRSYDTENNSSGYYTISHEWFEKFVYNIVVHKKYCSWRLNKRYSETIKTPIRLPENDILG
jgi:bleomycin hydrolase